MKSKGYEKLKFFFVKNGIRQWEIADEMKLNRITFNKKLNRNGAEFSRDEIEFLCTKYDLDANEFFLLNQFHKMEQKGGEMYGSHIINSYRSGKTFKN